MPAKQASLNNTKHWLGLILLTLANLVTATSFATTNNSQTITISHPPRIAIVLDDLGSQYALGLRAISIPRNGPITYAVLPHTIYGKRLAELAHKQKDEVILHMPMEPTGDYNPHKGMLTANMEQHALIKTLRENLDEVPYITGINNHMGSRLTQKPNHMRWIMEELKINTSLFFLDSVTSGKSVAYDTAKDNGVPSLKRDIFLDSIQSIEFVEQQFGKLLSVAMQQGYAIGIGHPYPETLLVLEKYLPTLQGLGFDLVTLSDLLNSPSTIPYQYTGKSGRLSTASKLTDKETFIYNHHPQAPLTPSPQNPHQ